MLYLYSLFVLIHLLLHAYFDFCLSVFFWLITSHKSIPDLGIDPSRASVKLSRATLGTPSRHPSFLFGGFKGPEGSPHIKIIIILYSTRRMLQTSIVGMVQSLFGSSCSSQLVLYMIQKHLHHLQYTVYQNVSWILLLHFS